MSRTGPDTVQRGTLIPVIMTFKKLYNHYPSASFSIQPFELKRPRAQQPVNPPVGRWDRFVRVLFALLDFQLASQNCVGA